MIRPLRIRYTDEAQTDLDAISTFIAQDNPMAAAKVLVAVDEAVVLLSHFPEKSRQTRRRGLRALALSHYRYIVFFRIKADVLEVVHVLHGARRHPGFQEEAADYAAA